MTLSFAFSLHNIFQQELQGVLWYNSDVERDSDRDK